jgi:hypothetical protein
MAAAIMKDAAMARRPSRVNERADGEFRTTRVMTDMTSDMACPPDGVGDQLIGT